MDTDRFYLMKGEHFIVLKTKKNAPSSTFSYCMPIKYNNQTPILLTVDGNFLSYRIADDQTEHNKIIIFKLPPLKKGEKIKINFEYWVLIKKFNKENLPKNRIPLSDEDLPKSVKKWLLPTKSVQSNNILIRTISHLMKGFRKDLFWFVKKVMIWNAFRKIVFPILKRALFESPILNRVFLVDRYYIKLEDSFSTLLFGGLCAGQANIAAAMFRAQKIPARVLVTTTSFYGKDYWIDAQHYINEFYCPDYGWIQSQSGRLFLTRGENIILRILYPKDENIAGNGLDYYGGMAPWFWIEEKNIIFDKPLDHMQYKLPKSRKVGVPVVRAWVENTIDIPHDLSDEIFKLTGDVWDLFIKNSGSFEKNKKIDFDSVILLQNQAVKELTKFSYTKYLEKMKEAKNIYLNA